jgi:hypothetical protein
MPPIPTLQHILDEAEKEFDEKFPRSQCSAHEKITGSVCVCDDLAAIDADIIDFRAFLSSHIRHAVEAYAEAVRIEPRDFRHNETDGARAWITGGEQTDGFNAALAEVESKSRKFLGV